MPLFNRLYSQLHRAAPTAVCTAAWRCPWLREELRGAVKISVSTGEVPRSSCQRSPAGTLKSNSAVEKVSTCGVCMYVCVHQTFIEEPRKSNPTNKQKKHCEHKHNMSMGRQGKICFSRLSFNLIAFFVFLKGSASYFPKEYVEQSEQIQETSDLTSWVSSFDGIRFL